MYLIVLIEVYIHKLNNETNYYDNVKMAYDAKKTLIKIMLTNFMRAKEFMNSYKNVCFFTRKSLF